MRVRVKIQHDKAWRPEMRRHERYWVSLPDGQYFPIFSGAGGNWYQMYAPHMDYPSQETALTAALQHVFAKGDGPVRYRRIRVKERVFSFDPMVIGNVGRWVKKVAVDPAMRRR